MIFNQRVMVFIIILWVSLGFLEGQSSQFIYPIDENKEFNNFQSSMFKFENQIYFTYRNNLFELNEEGKLLDIIKIPGLGKNGHSIVEMNEVGILFCGLTTEGELVLTKTNKNLEALWSEIVRGDSKRTATTRNLRMVERMGEKLYILDNANFYVFDELKKEVILKWPHSFEFVSGFTLFNKQITVILQFPSLNEGIGVVTYDTLGNKLWEKPMEVSSVWGGNIATDTLLYLTGYKGIEINEGYLIAIKPDGTTKWEQSLSQYAGQELIQTNDNGFLVRGNDREIKRISVLKTDSLGNQEWKLSLGDEDYSRLIQTNQSNYLVLGGFNTLGRIGGNFIKLLKLTDARQLTNNFKWYRPNKSTININNIQTSFDIDNYQFNNVEDIGVDDLDFFKIPNSKPLGTIASGGTWIGGLNNADQLHLAAQGYIFDGFNVEDLLRDYQPGVIEGNSEFYNQIWSVYSAEVESFRKDMEDGIIEDGIPFDILRYPAKGNIHSKALDGTPQLIDQDLAPFVDVNNDAIYNPYDGDYPAMKGDQMLWWISNDAKEHQQSNGQPLEVEIHHLAYAYNHPSNPLLANTLFLEKKVVNRSENDYHDFYIGEFTDFSIDFCEAIDYAGCHPSGNFYFGYDNKDFLDSCFWELPTDIVPIQTVTFLNQPLNSFIYQDASEPLGRGTQFPSNDQSFYNFLKGTWADGMPIHQRGMGYATGADNTQLIFPGNPADPTEWSLCSITPRDGFDGEVVGSTGPYDLQSGESITLSLAFTYFEDIPHPCPDIDPIAQDLEALRCFFNAGNVAEVFTVNLGKDTLLAANQSIRLNAGENGTSYEWSDGTRSQEIEITEPGTYGVTVTAANDCKIKDQIVVDRTTSTNEFTNAANFLVYPNPASEAINIELISNKVAEDMELQLVNYLGQQTVLLPIRLTQGEVNTFKLPVKNIASGSYLLYLNKDGVALDKRKVIVVK